MHSNFDNFVIMNFTRVLNVDVSNMYVFDRGVREVNEKVTGRGMKLKNGNGRE